MFGFEHKQNSHGSPSKRHLGLVMVVTNCSIFVTTYLIKNIYRNSSQEDLPLHRPNVTA